MGRVTLVISNTDWLFGSEREAPQPAVSIEVAPNMRYSLTSVGTGVVGECRAHLREDDLSTLVVEVEDGVIPDGARLHPIFHTGADGVMRLRTVNVV